MKMTNKLSLPILMILLVVMTSCGKQESNSNNAHEHQHGTETSTQNSKSPRLAAMSNIGSNHIHIDYSSPRVRDRLIYGGLVGFNQVWVTGAHSATSISFSEDIRIEGELVKKGKYGFFTIPQEETWVVILNENFDQHLADDYNEDLDVFRIEVPNSKLAPAVEELTFEVIETGEKSGQLKFQWGDRGFQLGLSN